MGMIQPPLYLVDDENLKAFDSLEYAGLYMEWVNANNPLFPDYDPRVILVDSKFRRVILHAEYGDVKSANLASEKPNPSDIARIARQIKRMISKTCSKEEMERLDKIQAALNNVDEGSLGRDR